MKGQRNNFLDVGGLQVGQMHDEQVKTGVSVILPNQPALCSVDVRGGGPGTRETDTLQDGGLIERVHGIVLAGGSVYGLAAADSVALWLGMQRRGYEVAGANVPVSPIVPAAILFDNANGGDKDWGMTPPFGDLGLQACMTASAEHLDEGAVGAGFGARAGIYAGGMGSASEMVEGFCVAALIAANPVGSPFLPGPECFWAWACEQAQEFGGRRPPENYQYRAESDSKLSYLHGRQQMAGQSTVIGVVATNAPLGQKQLKRLAMMGQDGLAMAVQPAHTPLDGDTLFAMSTAETDLTDISATALAVLGSAAARCVARALSRGVYLANL